jgi:Flp pilus assembly protein TadG
MRRRAKRCLHRCRGFHRRTQGVSTVEFAFLGLVLIFIIAGIIDFGHAWYMQQVITNASREGAYYATSLREDQYGKVIAPNSLSPSVSTYVSNIISDLSPTITLSGAGVSTGARPDTVTVRVQVSKTWFMLGPVMDLFKTGSSDAFDNPMTLSASTTLGCQGPTQDPSF